MPLLAPHHTVVTYDQRGYGRSPRPDGPYSLVEDLGSVLDTAGLDRAALVGTSRGGRHRDRLHAHVSRSGSPRSSRSPRRCPAIASRSTPAPDLERRWDEAEAAGDLAALADIDLEVWAPLGVDPELRAMAVENVEWSNADDPGTWADPPAVGRLSEIRVPTLVITGGRDLRAIAEIGDVLAAGISGARREVIEDADHVVGWRTPDELARLVLEFLRLDLDQQRVALAAAGADRREAEPAALAAELVDHRREDPRARGADRVAERDRAAVHVHGLRVGVEQLHRVQRDRAERLVHLDALDVADRLAGLPERHVARPGRRARQVGELVGDVALRDDRRQHLEAALASRTPRW